MSEQNWITTSIPDFRLRFAVEGDIPLIFKFINELAEYEKLKHKVVSTEELLRKNLFGEKAHAEVVLGFEGEIPSGFALFFHNFSTFLGKPGIYLEDLYIRPRMRGKGYGQTLLSYLARLTVERDCGRLEWSVLDWNEPAIGFYEQLGARAMNAWTVWRLTDQSLNELAEIF